MSGIAVAGGYEIMDVFDEFKDARVYRNRMDGREDLLAKHGCVADVTDVRILETTERI